MFDSLDNLVEIERVLQYTLFPNTFTVLNKLISDELGVSFNSV